MSSNPWKNRARIPHYVTCGKLGPDPVLFGNYPINLIRIEPIPDRTKQMDIDECVTAHFLAPQATARQNGFSGIEADEAGFMPLDLENISISPSRQATRSSWTCFCYGSLIQTVRRNLLESRDTKEGSSGKAF